MGRRVRLVILLLCVIDATLAVPGIFEHLIHSKIFEETLTLGRVCQADSDCAAVLHAECRGSICECAPDHFAHPHQNDLCQSAAKFAQSCSATLPCQLPFECLSDICQCPEGFIHHLGTCMKRCRKGEIAIAEWNYKCVKLRGLGEECAYDEQCQNKFSECAGERCTCRMGTVNANDTCIAAPQCPFGPAPIQDNSVIHCKVDSDSNCPTGHYCQAFHYHRDQGFCCPITEAYCPIGVPHPSADCTNCPYETHSCYTFSIGLKQHSLCCPADCHRSSPIRDTNRCLPTVPFGGECFTDPQCHSLIPGAVCSDGFCACPAQMMVKDGKCHPSPLKGECTINEDCREMSQLRCSNGHCVCAPEHVPEPFVDNPMRCIPAATCPTASGLFKKLPIFAECNEIVKCAENEYCREWYQEVNTGRNYSLCCPKPGIHEYNTVCGRFGMSLVLTNSLDAQVAPLSCGLHTIEDNMECPDGSACVFNPFSKGDGICCRTLNRNY